MPPLHTAAPLFVSIRGSLSVFVPLVLIVRVAVFATVVTPAPCIVPAVQFKALVTNTAPLPSSTPEPERFSVCVLALAFAISVPDESASVPTLSVPLVVTVAPVSVTVPAPLTLLVPESVCVPTSNSSVAPPATLNAPVCVPLVVSCTVPLLMFMTPVLFTRSFTALKPNRVTPVPADFVSVPLLINPG